MSAHNIINAGSTSIINPWIFVLLCKNKPQHATTLRVICKFCNLSQHGCFVGMVYPLSFVARHSLWAQQLLLDLFWSVVAQASRQPLSMIQESMAMPVICVHHSPKVSVAPKICASVAPTKTLLSVQIPIHPLLPRHNYHKLAFQTKLRKEYGSKLTNILG